MIRAITDGGETVSVAASFQGYLRDTADTTTGGAGRSVIEMNSLQHDGANTTSAVAADGNIF